jgi:hypothetical protein
MMMGTSGVMILSMIINRHDEEEDRRGSPVSPAIALALLMLGLFV